MSIRGRCLHCQATTTLLVDPSRKSPEALYLPCAQALSAAPLERQRQAAEQLLRLRQGLPSLADALRNDFITRQLLICGGLLTPQQWEQLPPVARGLALLSAAEYQKAGAYAPLLGRPAWALLERAFGEAIAAAERPPHRPV